MRFKISLRLALVALAILPPALAVIYYRELRVERYECVTSFNGQYRHESMWKRYVWERTWRLEYLLVYLPAERKEGIIRTPGSMTTVDPLATSYSGGISCIPSGLYFRDQRVNQVGHRCYVFCPDFPGKESVEALNCDPQILESLTLEDVKSSSSDAEWWRKLLPALEKATH